MKTLASEFASFAELAVPSTAGPAQRHAIKMAFYAGAAALYGLLTDAADADETDEVAVTRLDGLARELHAYAGMLPGTPR